MMFGRNSSPAKYIDHTLLKPTATRGDIETLCEEAVEYGFASVCVPPELVPVAVGRLYGSTVAVGSVVGFPCGYSSTRQKVLETADLVAAGADEIDMVVQIGHLLAGDSERVKAEIAQVVVAARDAMVKVIIECCYLDNEQKRLAAELVISGGAAFVKTSTGFGPGGATLGDVELLKQVVGERISIKASGGIRSLQDCEDFVVSGATRIGTSSGVSVMKEWYSRYV